MARILSWRREYSLLSVLKAGEVNEAIERLSRSPRWVWVAIDPVSTLLLALDLGKRKLGMAQRLVQQVAQVIAPACAPRCVTDGFQEYTMALLAHDGPWGQPPHQRV